MTEPLEYGIAGMNVSANPANEIWQEIQRAVESLSALARDEISPDHFYGELVRFLSQLTSASVCRVWGRETLGPSRGEDSGQLTPPEPVWTPVKKIHASQHSRRSGVRIPSEAEYANLVATAAKSLTETFLDAGLPLAGTTGACLPNDTLFQRVLVGDDVVAVIELALEEDRSPSQREGAQHLANVTAEIASDFHRNWQLRQLRDREQRREKLERFLDRVHRTYDLRRVAYAIAAEGKELIDCDRLSLVLNRGRGCRVLAVSGVQKPDRRSPTVLCIERLVNSKIHMLEPQWYESPGGDTENLPLNRYFSETDAKYIGLLPLVSVTNQTSQPERIGTLLVEMFETGDDTNNGLLRSRANWLVRHASNAISNAVHVNRLPLLSISRWLDRNVTRGKRIPWLAIFAFLLVAVVWFVAWMPTDFRIEARGELVPVKRESIYAPRPGTVVGFPLLDESARGREDAQGTQVKPGDTVVRLESADLDYELTSLLGEQSTVDQQLETIAVSIGQFGGSRDAESRSRYDDLAAQAAELRIKQTSIARRIRLIKGEQERLSIKASIPGRILTWDVVNELMLRPVQQGDLLLEVVDLDGPWEIELYVRDRHIGYVMEAHHERSDPLSISFFHRSDPQRAYSGTIKSIAMATEVYPEYGSAVRVIGTINPAEKLAAFRPGTTLVAMIDCGKRPLAFVLCYDLIHTIRMWMLF